MKKFLIVLCIFIFPSLALAQSQRNPCAYTTANPGSGNGCIPVSAANPLPVQLPAGGGGTVTANQGTANTPTNAWPVAAQPYPSATTAITGNAAGTTSAVVGTLAGVAAKTTYVCGFNVSAIGGTAAVGPITIAGLTGSSMVYQMASTASGNTVSQTFTPCIPASAVNTAITITTTANGTATAVDVNSWGFQQ